MVKHSVDNDKCRGCGKCLEECGLELWELIEIEGGQKRARIVEEAKDICHMCLCCRDVCPEDAITITEDE